MNLRLLMSLAPAAIALATVAHAQPAGPPPSPGPGAHTVMMHRGGPAGPEMKAMHEAMMKQHLEDLKTVLRLRPDQEAALQAFVSSHHAGGPMMMMRGGRDEKEHGGAASKPMTTPDRLAMMARHEDAMTAERKTAREGLAKFYAALSPDQQKVFDALHRLQGPGGHGADGVAGHGVRRIMIRRGPGGGPPMPGHGPD